MRILTPLPGKWQALRVFHLVCLLCIIVAVAATGAPAGEYLVYVGTYTGHGSEGIYAYRFNPATGEASPLGLAASTENPSFLAAAPNARFLYAVNELDTFQEKPSGAVSVFEMDRGSGKLNQLQQVPSLGAAPAHLSLDRSGRFLLVANYNGGNSAVFPIGDDGRLASRSAFVEGVGSSVNPERQAGPHAHSIQVTPDNRYALVADLGLDKLLMYRFDSKTGSLTPGTPDSVLVHPGSGPRHVAFAPSGRVMYLMNEMASTVTVYAYDPGPGTLREMQTISALPADFKGTNTAAEIEVDARGRFLYASNRGDDSIAVFAIKPDSGSLELVERAPSGGRNPRHFAIDPTGKWLFVANQDSNRIRLFQVDSQSGRLTATPRSLKVVAPVCVTFVPAR